VVVDGAREAAAILTQRFADTLAAQGKVPPHGFGNEPLERRFMLLSEGNEADVPLLFRKELHMPEMWPLLGGDRLVAAAHRW
jgi:hypothetical protein